MTTAFVAFLVLASMAAGVALMLHPADRPHHTIGGLILLTGGGIGLMTVVAPAFAADASVPTTIDLSPIIQAVVAFGGAALTGLGSWVLLVLRSYLVRRTGIEIDADTRVYLDHALNNAVSWGAARAERALIGKDSVTDIDLHNATVAAAVQYALDRVPDALAHFGVTPTALETMIEARLATVVVPKWSPGVVGEAGPKLTVTGPASAWGQGA